LWLIRCTQSHKYHDTHTHTGETLLFAFSLAFKKHEDPGNLNRKALKICVFEVDFAECWQLGDICMNIVKKNVQMKAEKDSFFSI